jgi:serine/threonine-protein kinase RsbW
MQSLTIHNKVPEISKMSHWLTDTLMSSGFSNRVQFRADLCMNEAVTNIMSYAYPESGLHEIHIELAMDDELVTITVIDDGIAFNPFDAPEHVQPDSLEEAEIGGLGIGLIRNYIDDYHYKRVEDKNILSLTLKLSDEEVLERQAS